MAITIRNGIMIDVAIGHIPIVVTAILAADHFHSIDGRHLVKDVFPILRINFLRSTPEVVCVNKFHLIPHFLIKNHTAHEGISVIGLPPYVSRT